MYYFIAAIAFIVGILTGTYSASYWARSEDTDLPPGVRTIGRALRTSFQNPPYIDYTELEKYNSDEYVAELEQIELDKQAMYGGRIPR